MCLVGPFYSHLERAALLHLTFLCFTVRLQVDRVGWVGDTRAEVVDLLEAMVWNPSRLLSSARRRGSNAAPSQGVDVGLLTNS